MAPSTGDDDWPRRYEYANGGYVPVHSHPLASCSLPIHLQAAAPPPSYTETVYSGDSVLPCGTVFSPTAVSSLDLNANGNVSSQESMSGTETLKELSAYNKDNIVRETNSPASATTHNHHQGNSALATRVFIIPLPDPPPSTRPHSDEIAPLLPT